MGDWSQELEGAGSRGILHPGGDTPVGEMAATVSYRYDVVAGVWTANRAVYQPVRVGREIAVTDAFCRVVTQNGNLDIGLYDWAGARIVSTGSVAVAAAGVQLVALADTVIKPGWYFLAFACSSATAVFRHMDDPVGPLRVCGLRQQAAAFPLPATATFAAYAIAMAPLVAMGYRAAA